MSFNEYSTEKQVGVGGRLGTSFNVDFKLVSESNFINFMFLAVWEGPE